MVDQALSHPYLRELHSQMKEPVCGSVFDSGFETRGYTQGQTIPKEDLQDFMFQEMLQLRPIGEESMESMELSTERLELNEESKIDQAEAKYDGEGKMDDDDEDKMSY